MYWHLISALVLIAVPVYTIVAGRWAADDNHLFNAGVRVALLVTSGSISGACFAVALVCYQGYSHLWLAALPLLSGGSVYSLFNNHSTAGQGKSSLIGLAAGLAVGLVAAQVIMWITFNGGLASVDYYVDVLSDNDSAVKRRHAATTVLGRLGDKRAVDPLIKALSNDHIRGWARHATVEALGQLGDKRAVRPLIDVLSEDDLLACHAAAKALGRLGDDRAVDPLIKVLSDDTSWLCEAAAEALGQLGNRRAIDPLIEALSYDDGEVRSAAKTALKKLGHGN